MDKASKTAVLDQPRLVLFASQDEFDAVSLDASESHQDTYTLAASRRLEIPYESVTPSQRSLMKVVFMQAQVLKSA